MAKTGAVHSVGHSLITHLKNSYPEAHRAQHPCEFRLLSSSELDDFDPSETAVTLYLYRAVLDDQVRHAPGFQEPNATAHPLLLCLHYMAIVWADSAAAEHTIAAWVMSELHQHPILDGASLSADGGWDPGEQVHVVPMEMTNEDLSGFWKTMSHSYRLSLPYIVRVVRVDPDEVREQ